MKKTFIVSCLMLCLVQVLSQNISVQISQGYYFFDAFNDGSEIADFYSGSAAVNELSISYKIDSNSKIDYFIKSGISRHIVGIWFAGGRPLYVNLGLEVKYPLWKENIFLISDLSGYYLTKKFNRNSVQNRVYSTLNIGLGIKRKSFFLFLQSPLTIIPITYGKRTVVLPGRDPISTKIWGEVIGLRLGVGLNF